MTFSIAEAARRSGLTIDTLRYYERIELLEPPARDSGGRRVYTERDLSWLEFLTKLRTTGMPIRMMRQYAGLRHGGLPTTGQRRAILVEHRRDVQARIAELQGCLEVLNYKIDNYEQCLLAADERAELVEEVPA